MRIVVETFDPFVHSVVTHEILELCESLGVTVECGAEIVEHEIALDESNNYKQRLEDLASGDFAAVRLSWRPARK